MEEHLLCVFGLGIRQQLTECVLIILVIFITMFFTMLYFGQRTRIITPFANYRVNCRLPAGSITNVLGTSASINEYNGDLRGDHNV